VHGMGSARARHEHAMLCVNGPLVFQYDGQTLVVVKMSTRITLFSSEVTVPIILPAQGAIFSHSFPLIVTYLLTHSMVQSPS